MRYLISKSNNMIQDRFAGVREANFCDQHDIVCNQKYFNNIPYSFHLDMVYAQAHYYMPKYKTAQRWNFVDQDIIRRASYGHDAIEDSRMTYNDILNTHGKEIAEIVFLCTEQKGRNRDERKPESYYNEIATNSMAVFVKLCDIIANVKFSFLTMSDMFDKYKSEYFDKVKPAFHVFHDQFPDMFELLDGLFLFTTKKEK